MAHTLEQREYNLLNKLTTPIRQIEPREDRIRHEDRGRQTHLFREHDRPQYQERFRSMDDKFREDEYRRESRNRYDRDYSPRHESRADRWPFSNNNKLGGIENSRPYEDKKRHYDQQVEYNHRFQPYEDK